MDTSFLYGSLADQIRNEGLAIWPGLFPDVLIDSHLTIYEPFFRAIGDGPTLEYSKLTLEKQMEIRKLEREFHRNHSPTFDLFHTTELVKFLRFYFEDEPVSAEPLTGLYSRATTTHNDSTGFLVSSPRGSRLRVWGALEDISDDAGPLYLIPQSHTLIARRIEDDILNDHPQFRRILGEQLAPTTAEMFFAAFKPIHECITARIQQAIETLNLKKFVPRLKKGDALLFDVDLVHGTMPIRDLQLTRKHLLCYWSSLSTRCFPPRVYFGANHDFREAAPPIEFDVVRSPLGSRIDNWLEAVNAYSETYTREIKSSFP